MQSIRRAALRSAVSASASVRVAASPATPFIRSVAQQSAVFRPAALAMAARYFSQTARVANEYENKTEGEGETAAAASEDATPASDSFDQIKPETATETGPRSTPAQDETPYGVFIRNMVFDATEPNLKEAFEHYGKVANVAISRDPRGLSRGYGFVWFETEEAQQKALAEADGSFWHGRRIIVQPRIKGERSERPPRTPREPAAPAQPSNTLYIGNLPYETTDADLNVVFRELEGLLAVRVAVDRSTGWPRGFAHADFTTVENAVAAVEYLRGRSIGTRELRIDYAQGVRGSRRNNNTNRPEQK